MSNTLKFSGPIKVANFASAPSNPEEGVLYFDTTGSQFKMYQDGGFKTINDQEALEATTGAAIIGYDNSSSGLTADDLQAAIDEIESRLDAAETSITNHLDGSASQHDATEIDYERTDGSKKNIQASSDEVEAALTDLDDAIGTLDASPDNYTPAATTVTGHLQGIDDALITAGSDEKLDNAFKVKDETDQTKKMSFDVGTNVPTATEVVVTIPSSNVDLSDIATNASDIDNLETLSGVASGSTHLATFTGTIIADNQTIKSALQALETDLDAIQTLSGVAAEAVNLGTFTGSTIADNQTIKAAIQALETAVEGASAGLTYRGSLAAGSDITGNSTSNTYVDGSDGFYKGDFFKISSDGNITVSDGTIAVNTGDMLIVNKDVANDGSVVAADIDKIDNTEAADILREGDLTSGQIFVGNGSNVAAAVTMSGEVTMDNTGATTIASNVVDNDNIKSDAAIAFSKMADLTASRAVEVDATGEVVASSVTSTELGLLSGKTTVLGNVVEDTTPELGGNLSVGTNVIVHGADGVKRGPSASNFLEEEYIHEVTLNASQTNTVMTDLTFAHASFEGCEITYKVKEATSGDIRIGTLRIVTNGTAISYNDAYVETADTGITFDAVINSGDVNVRYSSGTNGAVVRLDVKRIKA